MPPWAGAVLVWACATLSVYVLNGVMDVEEDRVNDSSRPIARGDLSVRSAVGGAAAFAAVALVGAFAFYGTMGWSVASALALGWVYSGPPFYLKRWPAGLAVVAVLGGLLTYHAGFAANGGVDSVPSLLVFAATMSLWMGLVGQTKDLSDVPGDKRAGRRTGPVAWGEDAARLVLSGVAVSLGGTYVVAATFLAPDLIWSAAVVACGSLAVAALALGGWSRWDARSARRRPYRAFMMTQYLAHLAVLAV